MQKTERTESVWTLRYHVIRCLALCFMGWGLITGSPSVAQDDEPEPQILDVELESPDGVELKMKYYQGSSGKDSIPVLILHDWESQASDYEPLATFLFKQGYAVAVPDLRGHGGSVYINVKKSRFGEPERETLEIDKFKAADIVKMVKYDIETVKRHLIQRHNAGELNIDKLCVVGVGVGSLLALNWAVEDWNWPVLAIGKQGQDVKALALISPPTAFQRVSFDRALNHKDVRSRLSIMIAYGKQDARANRAAESLFGKFSRYHPKPPEGKEQELTTLFKFGFDTSLQANQLLAQEQFQVKERIDAFIQLRIAPKDIEWVERKSL